MSEAMIERCTLRLGLLAAAAVSAWCVLPGAAAAATTYGASCMARAAMSYEGTLSPQSGWQNWSSQEPSTIKCAGNWGDTTLAGDGSYSSSGAYVTSFPWLESGPTCLAGSGRGSFRATVPTHGVWGGEVELKATYEFVQIASTRYITGTGTAEFQAIKFNTPRPEVHVEDFTLRGIGQVVPGPGPNCLTAGAAASTIVEELELTPDGPGSPNGAGAAPEENDAVCARKQTGSGGADRLTGTSDGDLIGGRGGDDAIRGLAGHDCLHGDGGSDRLTGASGGDALAGGPGPDVLRGGAGKDALSGGRGSDLINAGAGDDHIDADDGRPDRVRCGSGADRVRADKSDRLAECEQAQLAAGRGR